MKDKALLSTLHLRWRSCALCGSALGRLSLHHVHRHPRDDVEANLIMLCGSGTTGCHGDVEHRDPEACQALVRRIRVSRPDTFAYLTEKLGSTIAADQWLTNLARSKS